MLDAESLRTLVTSDTTEPAFTLQTDEEAGIRITQSDIAFIWQVRTNRSVASSSVIASSM